MSGWFGVLDFFYLLEKGLLMGGGGGGVSLSFWYVFLSMIPSTCFLTVSLPICSKGKSSKPLWQLREKLAEY